MIRLGLAFENITLTEHTITLGAAALWSGIPMEMEGGLWDAIRQWPGSVGSLMDQGGASELTGLAPRRCAAGRSGSANGMADGGPPPSWGEQTVLLRVHLRRAPAARNGAKAHHRRQTVQRSPGQRLGQRVEPCRCPWNTASQMAPLCHRTRHRYPTGRRHIQGFANARKRTAHPSRKNPRIDTATRIPVLARNEPGRRNQ